MEIVRIPHIVQDTCRKHLMKGRTIGLVPTMGALHEGHMSLIKRSLLENDITVASIFVNPLQFGPLEDLDKYPRPIDDDVKLLRDAGIDTLFLPDNALMYSKGHLTNVEVGALGEKLCGAFRPGHFRGVATVVAKLFNIVDPTRAYFGQKDFQQTVVTRRMAKDLNFGVEVVVCPTIREEDGLAMSSRNAYLDVDQRKAATSIYRALNRASEGVKAGTASIAEVKETMLSVLNSEPLIGSIDYAAVVDPETLEDVAEISGDVVLVVAVRIGDTRLIDNIIVNK